MNPMSLSTHTVDETPCVEAVRYRVVGNAVAFAHALSVEGETNSFTFGGAVVRALEMDGWTVQPVQRRRRRWWWR